MKKMTSSDIALELLDFLDRETADIAEENDGYYFMQGATMFAAHLRACCESPE